MASTELHHYLASFPDAPAIHQLAVTKLLQYRVLDIGVWRHQTAKPAPQVAGRHSGLLQRAANDIWVGTHKFLFTACGLSLLNFKDPAQTQLVEFISHIRQVGPASSDEAPGRPFLSKQPAGTGSIHCSGVLYLPLYHSRKQEGRRLPCELSDGGISSPVPS